MPLSRKEIESLMRLVGKTKESEIDCERCIGVVAEFAEQQLAGKTISEGLKAVEHHLSICDECREEYEALRRALVVLGDDTDE
jgi:predicted anti-sigma-YlaC factor YlaD